MMGREKKSVKAICLDLLKAGAFECPVIEDLNSIPKGDMPGDQIKIDASHIQKANTIFNELLNILPSSLEDIDEKVVISVHGGSGVGKSEVGSLLAYYFNYVGIGSYVLSGDNYPNRIPEHNDAERLRTFRSSGVKALSDKSLLNEENKKTMLALQHSGVDADTGLIEEHPWMNVYQKAGRQALMNYLGSSKEINFTEINQIISKFKKGDETIMLKRMGRSAGELWYDSIDMSDVKVLVIEWTHGNNSNIEGVELPILLNSTPEETLAHRKLRNRDGGLDSPFTMMVLKLEQERLDSQAKNARMIVTKTSELISFRQYRKYMKKDGIDFGPMINAYPDSIGGTLGHINSFLDDPRLKDVFSSFYILPSIFNTDLDRGFSVIDYDINSLYGSQEDFAQIKNKNMDLKFDLILNHASVLSKEFQDILHNGKNSKYIDFFIDWNKFWEGHGHMTEDGYIQPEESLIKDMFFRKPGLPILNVRMPDGSEVPFWNTFYQEVTYAPLHVQEVMEVVDMQYASAEVLTAIVNEGIGSGVKPIEIKFGRFEHYGSAIIDLLESKRRYLGQMDLNVESPLVWEFYDATLRKLSEYGAKIVRLDAFAYAAKAPGEKNFLNEPGTWDILAKINQIAEKYDLMLLPEIHTRYEEGVHEYITNKGYMTYDFFLPGLLIDAFERQTFEILQKWIQEIIDKKMKMVNMLGCHDGIPLLDLKGLLKDEQIDALIEAVVDRGGMVKDLHGKKNIYYQVNATYFSALGEDVKKMLLARAIQMFMPGKPQVWYLDLLAGTNDHEAVMKAGEGGHKEINRTNMSIEQVMGKLDDQVVQKQLELLRFRKTNPAFNVNAKIEVESANNRVIKISWAYEGSMATIEADLKDYTYKISTKVK